MCKEYNTPFLQRTFVFCHETLRELCAVSFSPNEITGHIIGEVACLYLNNPDFAVLWLGKEDDGYERENIGGAGAG